MRKGFRHKGNDFFPWFAVKSRSTIDPMITKIEEYVVPTVEEIRSMGEKALTNFTSLPSLAQLIRPVTICGDIHGQYNDLQKLFRIDG
jgi:hypothetical protein